MQMQNKVFLNALIIPHFICGHQIHQSDPCSIFALIAVDFSQRVICIAIIGFSHISLSGCCIKDFDTVVRANFNTTLLSVD